MPGHVNLSAHATDATNLHEIWNNDLKKCITRRRVYERLAALVDVARLMDFIHPSTEAFVAILLALGYAAVLQFIDESNVNYLMHTLDAREDFDSFRSRS